MSLPVVPNQSVLATARKSIHHFGGFLKDQKPLIVRGVVASLALTFCELLRPWPVKLVIDRVLLPDPNRASGVLDWLSADALLALSAAAMLLIPLLLGVLNRITQVSLAQVGRKVTTRVRRLVCEHLQLLPLSFHHGARSGDLLVRVMGDVNMVRDILFSGWVSLVQRLLVFAGTFSLMLWLSPRLALLALVPIPLLAVSVKRSGGRMREAVSKQRRKEGSAAAMASELLTQIRGIKAFGAERRSARIFSGLSRSGERAGVLATKIAAGASLQAEVVCGAGLALVLFVGSKQVLAHSLSPGGLLVLLSYSRALYKPLRKLSRDGVRLAKAAACAERLFEVLDLPSETSSGSKEAPVFQGEIEFHEVVFAYGDRPPALDGFSARVRPGALCVLKGRNGSGKSTTLSLLLRLFEPQSGEITIDGFDAKQFDLESWRSRFAYVPQEDLLFAGTLAENLLFGRPDASDEELAHCIEVSGLDSVIRDLPGGLEAEIGEAGSQLSGGQRRLVSLARAALRSAQILLLDEPLEGLDPKARIKVARAIRQIANGRTTIVVSHSAVDEIHPDCIIEIRDGRQSGVMA